MAALPVVSVHFGAQTHVTACLAETARHNRDVYLIGDSSNRSFAAQWIDYRDLEPGREAEVFRSHFVNYSTNPHTYELNCFLRMFYVRALLDRLGIDACFHTDSDCALFVDVSGYAFETPDALTLHHDFDNPIRMTASVHNARLSREFLDRFVQVCFDVYVNGSRFHEVIPKIRYHRENGLPGGVCDMTLYSMVARTLPVQDLGTPRSGAAFDHRFGSAEGHELQQQYDMDDGHKRVTRRNEELHIHDVRGPMVRLLSIHFQGIAKRFVHLLDRHGGM